MCISICPRAGSGFTTDSTVAAVLECVPCRPKDFPSSTNGAPVFNGPQLTTRPP
jgi:hypothetical protein